MGIGAPGKAKANPTRAFPFPIVGVVALPLLLALDLFGLRGLDLSWGSAATYGGLAAIVGALFAYIWFGASSRVDLALYFWSRLLMLGILTVVFSLLALWLLGWPLLPSVAAGVSVAQVGALVFMIATDL